MNPVLAVIEGADAILSDPSHWTKRAYARDDDGNTALPEAGVRYPRYCLSGALSQASLDLAGNYGFHGARSIVRRKVAELFPTTQGVPSFNDRPETTFDDVKLVLRAAKLAVINQVRDAHV